MANIPILSFNAGELSPKIDARSDVEKYSSGCRDMDNMLPLIYGAAERRPGTKYIAATTGIDLVVPIEMVDASLGSLETGATIYDRSKVYLDSDNYDGATYYFEIVASNAHADTDYDVDLYDVTGSAVKATITVPANTSLTRYRSDAWTPADTANRVYAVRTPQTEHVPDTGTRVIIVRTARIIIVQTNATKTRIQIPLTQNRDDMEGWSIAGIDGNEATYGCVNMTISTTYEQGAANAVFDFTGPEAFSQFYKDSSQYATIDHWTFEAVITIADGDERVSATLWNVTDDEQVSDTELSHTGDVLNTLKTVDFDDDADNFSDLDIFEVYIKSSEGSSAYLLRSCLYVTLTDLSKAEIIWRVGKSLTAGKTAKGFTESQALINIAANTNIVAYYEVTAICADNSDIFNLYSTRIGDGTNDSDINVNSATKTRGRSDAIILASRTFYSYKEASTNNATPTSGWILLRVSRGIHRNIPFIYSVGVAYKIEMRNGQFRFIYNDSVLTTAGSDVTVTTPYQTTDLFEIQYKQRGDVMWLVHKNYAPRKLSRTSPVAFSLDEIEFKKGPFFVRNDLLDPTVTDTALMNSSVTAKGDTGTLTFDDGSEGKSFFVEGHVGALFKLIHPRETTVSSGSISATGTLCAAIDVKGTFHFNTHGNWAATLELQRNENGAGWETYRTYISKVLSGAGTRNIQYTGDEDADNVQYRVQCTAYTSDTVDADITVDESTTLGIVKVTGITSGTVATIEVIKALESTGQTRRWAEGAWSPYRGYPVSITFFEERCVYGGMEIIPTQMLYS